ncbi:hypothetical protein GN958_ATG05226 [Phytophthora infestans]|uniref:Uncharacterized protein n=1 Tax=Phytophthora infestans TaxID=4787 RepID=A0A8S9V2Z4_PHYIN|nr:hypothetical protein GN958_ATG05226 [Phytophthora infestans]
MRFRFGNGEEQFFVADILSLFEVENEESCATSSYDNSSTDSGSMSIRVDDSRAGGPRSRMRLRSKIERMRREIQTLGVELADLQPPGTTGGRGLYVAATAARLERRADTSRWKSIAMKNRQRRERAEHDNKVLKRMIAAQNMLAKSILEGRFRISSKLRSTFSVLSSAYLLALLRHLHGTEDAIALENARLAANLAGQRVKEVKEIRGKELLIECFGLNE